jgi:tRNA threonylcarbamoyladenosine biosynthesis protein TsaE
MAESSLELTAPDEDALLSLGARLARAIERTTGALVIYLSGDLGAGKTTFVRGCLRALGERGTIRSPTFTLLETYSLASRRVTHMDLFRLAAPDIESLGLRDLLTGDHVLFVEWPERAAGELPAPDLRVQFAFAGGGRRLACVAATRRGAELVQLWVR